jgi:hypothetical protein
MRRGWAGIHGSGFEWQAAANWRPKGFRRSGYRHRVKAGRRAAPLAEQIRVMYLERHAHSRHSFLDGAPGPAVLATPAAQLGMDALAVADHQGLCGAIKHGEADIRPATWVWYHNATRTTA